MRRSEFENVVSRVLDDLPSDFAEKLDNVQVVVSRAPSRQELKEARVNSGNTLLGLYNGIPRPSRGMNYRLVLPDKISIFQEPIEAACLQTGTPVAQMVRKVVLHEIAHHFGIADKRLRELGY